jgi:hypothetical protein
MLPLTLRKPGLPFAIDQVRLCIDQHSCELSSPASEATSCIHTTVAVGAVVATRSVMPNKLLASSLLIAAAMNIGAQTIQVGVVGGIAATDPDAFRDGESKRYAVGPSVEARFLGTKLGVELDAIYRRSGESFAGEFGPPPPEYTGPPPVTRFYVRSRTNSWEFPLIGKYYLRDRSAQWRPFVGTGYVLRLQWRETRSTTVHLGGSAPRNDRQSSTTGPDIGATAVAGVELRGIGRVSLQPQVRYTRWSNHSSFNRPLNHVDVGLSIRF